MSLKKEDTKNKWLYIEDDNPDDKIKNRPEWTAEKDREEIIFEPTEPSILEDWLENK